MKTLLVLMGLALPLCVQQAFDFKSLEKLDSLTSHKTRVTLDAGMLKLALAFIDGDKDGNGSQAAALKTLVNNLKGIYARVWRFDKKGQYSDADLDPFRAYLKAQQWSKLVESQDGDELSEVYIQPLQNSKFGGVAIIAEEARELTVVYINGVLDSADLQQLGGNMGIPEINLHGSRRH